MSHLTPLSARTVAISISESADMAILGLAEEHLRDAMAEVVRHLLAMGARLAYAGDLRDEGFTALLVELVARHRRAAPTDDEPAGVVSYLSWPVHAGCRGQDIQKVARELKGVAEVRCLDLDGRDIPLDTLAPEPYDATSEQWGTGLTAMRSALTKATDARVVLGGRVAGYKGRMPGIAEETLFALHANQPIFILGGFGGCARDIAVDLGLVPAEGGSCEWAGREAFKRMTPSSLNNGLTEDENRTLARTAHIDQAVTLVLRGMLKQAQVLHNQSVSVAQA
ncbi:hypothetical protein FF100_18795 [Methylobacterium terricola]|uniref:Uncharacterized protein n=1 Tax=Methylobacterium terricola TaxID=2583531 RepID=A0A5C4LGQ7_9HYPH|nr:hypothetical protein [Methylobacterium terricola]TNC11687.1 hypothetical protein FF100_18795 [Methylobacterium terricola]